MSQVLSLQDQRPIHYGHKRLIFQHPHDAGLLIKVMRPEVVVQRATHLKNRIRRHRHLLFYGREVHEFISQCARWGAPPRCMQPIEGFVQTDFGLGMVARKLCDRDGNLAPQLLDLVRRDRCVTGEIRARLDAFVAELLAHDVIVAKLTSRNLLLTWDAEINDHRFVMVDSFGERATVPIHQWSRLLNRMHTRSCFRRLIKSIESDAVAARPAANVPPPDAVPHRG